MQAVIRQLSLCRQTVLGRHQADHHAVVKQSKGSQKSLKVSKSRKQILKFSFEPKNE